MTRETDQPISPSSILVIEDSDTLRASVVEVLTWEGFRVAQASNGREGLERLHAVGPDLVICDIMMPDLDGYGVLAALRADPTYRTLPFIFLTALAERSDVRQGMELGAVDYLAKPFEMRDLLSAVRTQLRKHADYRQAADSRLEELSGQLITSLPHELRTPLTTVLGYAEIMIEDIELMDPSQIRDYLRIIRDAAMRIKHLTENYLLYAQLEVTAQRPGMLVAMRDQVSERPGQVVASIARGLAEAAERQADLSLSLDETTPPLTIAAEYFSKLVEELVANAFKFSKRGSTVHVSLCARPSGLVLNVCDAGRGMTREQIASIGAYMQFERHRYEQQGTGMGLALARKIVQLHGGRLDITSEPGAGTTANVELPIATGGAGAVATMRGVA